MITPSGNSYFNRNQIRQLAVGFSPAQREPKIAILCAFASPAAGRHSPLIVFKMWVTRWMGLYFLPEEHGKLHPDTSAG